MVRPQLSCRRAKILAVIPGQPVFYATGGALTRRSGLAPVVVLGVLGAIICSPASLGAGMQHVGRSGSVPVNTYRHGKH